MPGFVLGFVALAAIRTLVEVGAGGVADSSGFEAVLSAASKLSTACLVVAMASIGLRTDLSKLKHLGIRPFVSGLLVAAAVGAASATVIGVVT